MGHGVQTEFGTLACMADDKKGIKPAGLKAGGLRFVRNPQNNYPIRGMRAA